MLISNKVSGETEAKAILKGALRRNHQFGDQLMQTKAARMGIQKARSMKVVNRIFNEELNWYGDFLVGYKYFKKYGIGTTKHFKAEFTAIEPELTSVEGMGELCRFILGAFDSRKVAQCRLHGNCKLASRFYFHEHFLIRCIHRLNFTTIGDIAVEIYPVIEWLILNNIPLRRLPETNYFVFKNFIVVAEKLSHSQGLVFKTILLKDRLTDRDNEKFIKALAIHNDLDKNVAAVQVNAYGDIVCQIPPASGKSLLNSLSEKSHWVQGIFDAPEINII
ncbi:hypothetical protein [Shewanella sp.]|uniref:hypothetical protein n=1 Tax=Shewanella sp. TaxID=50422 RepID=UPI004048D6B4